MRCRVTGCPDRATARVRFSYGRDGWVDVTYCSRHSWPWRVGRGNGTADVEWL